MKAYTQCHMSSFVIFSATYDCAHPLLIVVRRAREVSKLQDEFQSSAAAAPQENLPTDDPDMPLSESIIDAMDAVQVKSAIHKISSC